jgi:Transposase/Transposase IS116/IS110/IS902 family
MTTISRFVGMDVHEATTSICIRDRRGDILQEVIIPTAASALRRFFPRHRKRWAITFEEGPLAQWMYGLLSGRVAQVVICNPRYNRLIRHGSKSDRIDAAKLSELLRLGGLKPVRHSPEPDPVAEMVKHYDALLGDSLRIMQRIRAAYRGIGVPAGGISIYDTKKRKSWLRRVGPRFIKERIESLYEQLDTTIRLRDAARCVMIAEASRHPAYELLRSVPYVGEVRAAQLVALIASRFYQSRRHLWSYAGLAVVVRSSSDHGAGDASKGRPNTTRGLTRNYNPRLKRVLKDIALAASLGRGPLRQIFDSYLERGLSPQVARVALARRVASLILAVLRDGSPFDPERVRRDH